MAKPKFRSRDYGEIQEFHQQLAEYERHELRMIYEYFWDDLICVVESLSTQRLLTELKSRTTLKAENYATMKEDLGVTKYSKRLVQDIFEKGAEAVIGFWESLYALHKDHPHPNLTGILDELIDIGHTLVQQILLDENGHKLSPELKESQKEHKQHLLKKTQNLVENKPPGSTQEVQHFYISERFVKLIVVSTDHFRQRSQNELVETGEKHERYLKKAQDELKHLYFNRLFHWCHESQCVPCSVMVSGVPGIGKTTLMQKFVYDWVTGKLYQRFAFVFFFKFRELNRLDKVSLETMILQQYPYLQRQLGNILGDPKKLLFIFDGLDESNQQMDFRSNKVCSNSKQLEDPIMIVGCLLKQSLLKGCSVLMTSRPTKLATINTDVFQRITEIMGFSFRERQMYFEHFFKNKELSEKAFHYVRENDTLYTFCYIPSYCWIICTVLSMCFKAQPSNSEQLMLILPKTVTQLFVTFVANILSNHSQDKRDARKLLKSIGWMAEHGVMNHFIVFDERYLKSLKVDIASQLLSSFMMESDQPPNVTFTFLHLTLQEFFAALVHYLDYCPEKLQKSLAKSQSFKDCRGEIFVRFLCGLSDVSTKAILKTYLGEFSSKSSEQVITWLQSRLPDLDHLNSNTWDKRKTLNLLTYFFESKNKALGLEILGSNRQLDFTGFHLSPLDCTVLSFILESCRKLNLSRCLIANEGLERLAPNLHTVEDISLYHNGLTDSSCPLLASAVRSNQSLRKLDLSYNNLEGPNFSDLVTALSSPTCRIEELKLCNAGLTDSSTSSLSLLISKNNFLKKLDLSGNKLEGPNFSELLRVLSSTDCSIEDMHVSNEGLTESSCSQLVSAISNSKSLRNFDLCDSKLDESNFGALMTALSSPTCKIENFIFRDYGLTQISCGLQSPPEGDPCLQRKLHITLDMEAGFRFHYLVTSLYCPTYKVEDLVVSLYEDSTIDCTIHALPAAEIPSQVKYKLVIYTNNYFSEVVSELGHSTCRIEHLCVKSQVLKERDVYHLAKDIRHNQSLRKLDLSGNKLVGSYFNDLIKSLSNPTCKIEELILQETGLGDEQDPQLASLSQNLNITHLDLSRNNFSDVGYKYIEILIMSSAHLKEIRIDSNHFSEKVKKCLKDLEGRRPGLKIFV